MIREVGGLLLVVATVAGAQDPARGGRGRRPAAQRADTAMVMARQAIENRIRAVVQPTDEQMVKLRQIDRRFEQRRTELNRDEVGTRRELIQAMSDTASVNQDRIAQLLDRTITFPGRRAALMEEEQKALAEVLTPLQRARYHAIQEGVRRLAQPGRGGPPLGRGGQPPNRPPQGAAPLATKRPPV